MTTGVRLSFTEVILASGKVQKVRVNLTSVTVQKLQQCEYAICMEERHTPSPSSSPPIARCIRRPNTDVS